MRKTLTTLITTGIVVGLGALATAKSEAAPLLLSDYYPVTGAQPTSCSYQEGTKPKVTTPVQVNPTTGAVRCNFDMATIGKGLHSMDVWASNGWGDSTKTPFSFDASVPAAPSGWFFQ